MTSLTPAQMAEMNGKTFPFRDVIKGVEGHDVLEFNNPALLDAIKTACTNTVTIINKSTNFTGRPNEFGNLVANFLSLECSKIGLDYQKPTDTDNKAKETGYPDGLIKYENTWCYLEIKTCEHTKTEQTFRTFFYSPSVTSKIIHDAPHLLVGFETDKDGDTFILNGKFYITDMFKKNVTLKLEYNTNNKQLYKPEDLLN
ncbi:MAG: type II restriction endonuclease MjaV [Treponemataceae bacterium]|nr:MAG: type II restriction endonuclease MjaV [Treponemataceae bacterium]